MSRKIYFRVDANLTIGRGHLSRSIAVAAMIKDLFSVKFLILNENKSYTEQMISDYNVSFIEKDNDVFQIITKSDLVWLDGYQFSEEYKRRLKPQVHKLIETNDIPYTATNVDIIFNHTPGVYREQFSDSTAKIFLGLDYAMLRKTFLDYAMKNKKATLGEGVFICFGGADPYRLGEKFVKQLLTKKFKFPIYWITSNSEKSSNFPRQENLRILKDLSEKEMIKFMLQSKVLLIPSSVLSFEAVALRKPFFTCYFVDNQKLIFEGLKDKGLALCFGYLNNETGVEKAVRKFIDFYHNKDLQIDISKAHFQNLKGHSKNLISNVLLAS